MDRRGPTTSPTTSPTTRWRVIAALVGGVVFGLAVLFVLAPGARATIAVDDAATLLAALGGAAAAAIAARRSHGATRRGWTFLALALLLWAVGEGIWGFYEVVLVRDVPFPSIADAAYLAAVVPAAIGLLSFPGGPTGGVARARALLDGCLVAGSMLFVVWALVLGELWRASFQAPLAQAISLLYPATDVVLATLAVMAIARGPAARRRAVGLVTAGVVAMTLADVVYGWLANHDGYRSGTILDVVWIVAYALLALGAAHPDAVFPGRRADDDDVAAAGVMAPYVPGAIAAVVALVRYATRGSLGPFLSAVGLVVVVAVVIRQFTALVDNLRLTRRLRSTVDELESSRAELRHLAYHDALTGLPNRTLFFSQLTTAAAVGPVAVLYIDLERFKQVNDSLGHAAGDEVLVAVAGRLRDVAGHQALVARLGGDEFAVLIAGPAARIAERVAGELAEVVRQPLVVQGAEVVPGASIGVARSDRAGSAPDEIVRWADAAMYSAKATKARSGDGAGGGDGPVSSPVSAPTPA